MTPVSAVITFLVTPFFDATGLFGEKEGALINYVFTVENISVVVASAVLAIFVNLSIFLVIGATSAVTYNVVGHFKTVLIIASSFLLFDYPTNWKNIFGMVVALGGMILYTHFKMTSGKGKPPASAPSPAPAAIVTAPPTLSQRSGKADEASEEERKHLLNESNDKD
jgi:solute carrier family 35 protein E3